jgi:hypothetical protein
MKLESKTFPKLQIILVFLVIFLQFCHKEKAETIDKEQFIEIYARLLIINELKVSKEFHDRLLQELYNENNVTAAEIDSTISYYNSNPREWIDIYKRTREKIQKIRTDFKTDHIKKSDSLRSQSKSKLPTRPGQKSFIDDNPLNKDQYKWKEKKSENKPKIQSEEN